MLGNPQIKLNTKSRWKQDSKEAVTLVSTRPLIGGLRVDLVGEALICKHEDRILEHSIQAHRSKSLKLYFIK